MKRLYTGIIISSAAACWILLSSGLLVSTQSRLFLLGILGLLVGFAHSFLFYELDLYIEAGGMKKVVSEQPKRPWFWIGLGVGIVDSCGILLWSMCVVLCGRWVQERFAWGASMDLAIIMGVIVGVAVVLSTVWLLLHKVFRVSAAGTEA